jgi:hypothetical protein
VLAEKILAPFGEVMELLAAVRVRLEIIRVRQRAAVHQRFPTPLSDDPGPRVLAVVTHLTNERHDPSVFVDRLSATLDGLFLSLSRTRLELALNSLPGRHVAAALPEHQRTRLQVFANDHVDDPLFLGFEAQEAFADRIDQFDWFLFLEDDLVLSDSLLLEKLAFFNQAAPTDAVLLPHRFEVWHGRKVWIDRRSRRHPGEDMTAGRLTELKIGGWRFAEPTNPHAGFYALTQSQVRRWLATGRQWYKLCSFFGPLESAATGCLEECFRLYKPHPDNIDFLEIRHFGTKYSESSPNLHWPADIPDSESEATYRDPN